MERNEIIKAYGTEFKEMTKHLLAYSDLDGEIRRKLGTAAEKGRIAIKPNLVAPTPSSYGATTHTEVVAGIIEYLHENGYKNITIVEGSWVGDRTKEAFEYCGYNALGNEYEVALIDGQKEKSHKVDCHGMDLNILNCVDDFDFLINVPVLKGHCQTQITCALKNMKGLIPNSEKRRFHVMGLHKPIAHLNTYIHQDFIVIDHICGDPDFEEGGNPLVKNCIMTALDPVLVDAYTENILGYEKGSVEYISLAAKLGVGSNNLDDLHIVTIEGENNEDLPETHKILEVNYAVEDTDSCSACYAMLIGALNRLKEEGLLDELQERLGSKICIGQGYRGKSGKCGIGNCTKEFELNVPGCPPDEEEIYKHLKSWSIGDRP